MLNQFHEAFAMIPNNLKFPFISFFIILMWSTCSNTKAEQVETGNEYPVDTPKTKMNEKKEMIIGHLHILGLIFKVLKVLNQL